MASRSTATSSYLDSLPEFASPARVTSLYSGIARKKQSNPPLYRYVVSWWQHTLQALAASGLQGEASADKLILHVNVDLLESLRWRKTGTPLGLGSAVVESTIPAGSGGMPRLIPLQKFWDTRRSIYMSPSLVSRALSYIVGKPLRWALEQLSLLDSEPDAGDEEVWKCAQGDYAILSNIEKAAEAVIRKQSKEPCISRASAVFSLDSFRAAFAGCALPDVVLSDLDIRVLVLYLSRDQRVVVADEGVIKFISPGRELAITEVDRGLLQMRTAISKLEVQVAEIQRMISVQTEKVVFGLRGAQKPLAMTHLRSCKRLEALLTSRLCALERLRTHLTTIESAIDDTTVIAAYDANLRSLRAVLMDRQLHVARVDATMDGMVDALATRHEIEGVMELDEIRANVDEDALVAELAGLEEEMYMEERKKTRAEELARRVEMQCAPSEAMSRMSQREKVLLGNAGETF